MKQNPQPILKYFLLTFFLSVPLLLFLFPLRQQQLQPPPPSIPGIRIRPGYTTYETYINRQLNKTLNPKLRQVWKTRDWDRKINVFSKFFTNSPPLVVKGDFHSQPFDDETFDFEFSNVFDHALYPDKFVGEIERTLKRGGVCVLHVAVSRRSDKYSANDLLRVEAVVEMFKESEVVYRRKVDGFGLDTEIVFRKKVSPAAVVKASRLR
ncbi:hypothetical protein LINPERHAP2_LOCUS19097 [Linum perenne]